MPVVVMRSYLFQEGVGEGLYTEFERTEVGRLVQALHLLGHERLVNWLALGIGGIHCGAERKHSSARARTRRRGAAAPWKTP